MRWEIRSWLPWAAVALVLCLLFRQCSVSSALREEALVNEQNAIALTDSVRTEIENNGRTFNAYRAALVADMDDLKDLNAGLWSRLDSLRRVKGLDGRPVIVVGSGVSVSSPPVEVPAEVYYVSPSGEARLTFEVDTSYDAYNSRHIAGSVDFRIDSMSVSDPRVTILADSMRVGLTTGLVEQDGVYRIFVSSDYPGFSVSSLEGAVLDRRVLRGMASDESTVVFGPLIGYGYGPGSERPYPFLGLGVTYNVNKSVKRLFR